MQFSLTFPEALYGDVSSRPGTVSSIAHRSAYIFLEEKMENSSAFPICRTIQVGIPVIVQDFIDKICFVICRIRREDKIRNKDRTKDGALKNSSSLKTLSRNVEWVEPPLGAPPFFPHSVTRGRTDEFPHRLLAPPTWHRCTELFFSSASAGSLAF